MDTDEAWQKWNEAVGDLNFCLQLYKIQMREGRYFLHEHPLSATSWQLPSVKAMLSKHGIISTYVNMCAYGMTSKDEGGKGLVSKLTRFMTNSPAIADKLASKCSNRESSGNIATYN